jgi:ABC-type multidrug transport system ATPase subunit
MTSSPRPSLCLAVRDLRVDRGGRRVIAGLDLDVHAGDVLLLTGPNGAGKTTLIRALAGLIAPVAGSIELIGGGADTPLAEQVHYLGHGNAIRGALTVSETLSTWRAILGAGGWGRGEHRNARPSDRVASRFRRHRRRGDAHPARRRTVPRGEARAGARNCLDRSVSRR